MPIVPHVSTPVERLLYRLELEEGATNGATTSWHGEAGENALNMNNRLFGGMVVAQTIAAAGYTDRERSIHSVQQVFLRGGSATQPLRYDVERLFTGRTYASLRVSVHQGDQVIAHAQVGLTAGIEGPDRQDVAPARPDRATARNRDELRNRPNWDDQPVEMLIDPATEGDGLPDMATWIRPAGPMPADPLMHQAVLGFVSDRGMMSVAWKPHGERDAMKGATLDHSMWFHRPLVFDDWHSYVMHSSTIAGGRGMNHGVIHDEQGRHVATTLQQGTIRPVRR